ncbi:MAG: electron transfer flavoprotein subunit alpha/FixB family protein [Flavobacteriaceae bacterium]
MSVLVYAETDGGKLKKVALEVASYGKAVADQMGTDVVAVTFNAKAAENLGNYGISKVLNISYDGNFDAKVFASGIQQAVEQAKATVVIVSSSADSRFLTPLLAVSLDAGYATNVVGLPLNLSPFMVKRSAFTNKAFTHNELRSEKKIIGVSNNAFGLVENPVSCSVEAFSPNVSAPNVVVQSVDKATDKVTIADAEVVVSGGRGLKGPENWHLIEELAETLGAATACSKPVSDMGWRPHSEHVGQTGKPVASNLYIAIGVSGAIQHLAGINSSKVKVVINNDPEAPFFKAADYGIVGDAFEVVPKLIEKLKVFKAQA